MPDEDELADKYARADERLSAAGLGWYEVSNWARGSRRAPPRAAGTTSSTGPARTGGASARAHTPTSVACGGGTSSTPRRTPSGSRGGVSPAHGRELLDAETRRIERVLLELRLTDGLPLDVLDDDGRAAVPGQVERGLVSLEDNRLVLTPQGRLLADAVVRDLLP